MTTKLLRPLLLACVLPSFALPVSAGFAPESVNSIAVRVTGTQATYQDDLETWTVTATHDGLQSGAYRYTKSSANVGTLEYFDEKSGSQTYSGTITLTFTSNTEGTFNDDYTGSYTGYVKGTFKIVAMDVAGRPIAIGKTVHLNRNESAKFRLAGKGLDVRKTGLVFKITEQPKLGKLNTTNLPVVVYQPKPGFTGTVKFTFIVKEGNTASKPATVKLVVE